MRNWWSKPVGSNISRSKRLVAALVAIAFVLPLLVFHYGFSPYHCVVDYCTINRALWGKDTEIREKPIPLKNLHTGQIVLENGKPIMVTPVRQGVTGIVIRDSIPTSVGLLGGLGAPLALLLTVLFLGLRQRKRSN